MGDVVDIRLAHVTGDTGVGPRHAGGFVLRAAVLLVAVEAARTVKGLDLLRIRRLVRIVAGNASQLSLACLETPAAMHLLNVAGELDVPVLVEAGATDQHDPGLAQFLAGPEIKEGLSESWLPPVAGEVALVTDAFSFARFEFRRVDNKRNLSHRTVQVHLNMLFAGTMAAFTANT